MATRVKKLARQLERPPVEVLGLLHAMGYVRYKSAQDMVGDDVIERLHRELRAGLTPVPLEVRRIPKKAPLPPLSPPEAEPPVAVQAARSAPNEPRGSELQAAIQQRDEALAALEAQREELELLRAELCAVQVELHAARAQQVEQVPPPQELLPEPDVVGKGSNVEDGDRFSAALQARGLRGEDEFERALGALARKRVLRELLGYLTVEDAASVQQVLERRLLLVGDVIDEELTGGVAVVAVAAERAEVPGGAALQRLVKQVGEQCLLSGLRRVTMVGLPPLWHRLLSAGLDPRVEIRVSHGVERTREQAKEDQGDSDAVVLLGVEVSEAAAEVYTEADLWLHHSNARDFRSFLEGWVVALREH